MRLFAQNIECYTRTHRHTCIIYIFSWVRVCVCIMRKHTHTYAICIEICAFSWPASRVFGCLIPSNFIHVQYTPTPESETKVSFFFVCVVSCTAALFFIRARRARTYSELTKQWTLWWLWSSIQQSMCIQFVGSFKFKCTHTSKCGTLYAITWMSAYDVCAKLAR